MPTLGIEQCLHASLEAPIEIKEIEMDEPTHSIKIDCRIKATHRETDVLDVILTRNPM